MEPFSCTQTKLIERHFFTAAGTLLVWNLGKLFELENGRVYLNLWVVKEEFFILFVLICFISEMPKTEYRAKVLRWLKFFILLCAGGGLAKYRKGSVVGRISDKA